MKCPKCRDSLKQKGKPDTDEFGFVVVDVCPTCQGVWLDKGELSRLNHSLWVGIDDYEFREANEDHLQIECPRCDVTMRTVSPSSLKELVIDRCPGCEGFWLDRGELDRVRDLADVISRTMLEKKRGENARLSKEREQEEQDDIWPFFFAMMNMD